MSTTPFDHKKTEALGLAILTALGITRPVCALSLHFRAGEMATMTVEEYMPTPAAGGSDAAVAQLSHFVLVERAESPASMEASHAG